MAKSVIVLLDAATLTRGDLDLSRLERLGAFRSFQMTAPSELVSHLEGASIALTNKVRIDGEALASLPELQLIQVCATGVNNVDLDAARARGVWVANVPSYSTPSVAQHALALLLNLATRVHTYAAEIRKWPESKSFTRLEFPVMELEGKTLGLVGSGQIGTRFGKIAEALGMRVRSWARPGAKKEDSIWERLPLEELFRASEVISLHCPLTEHTRHLINAETLRWFQPHAFLINTGRGDLVDENALADALIEKRIGGAGLDVLSSEPPPANHPLISLNLPNLIITPHTAWTSKEARVRLLQEVASNIEAFLEGKDRNRIG